MKRVVTLVWASWVTVGFVFTGACPAATNLGLVGTVAISADAKDERGETMGGFFSGMGWDSRSQTLFGLADRGPLDGKVDYSPRVQTFHFAIDLPATNFPNITLTHRSTVLLHDSAGQVFSGADASDTAWTNFPRTTAGVRALDPEGIVRAVDGTFWISDEYGPYLYHFDAGFKMLGVIVPPAHILPQTGPANARIIQFTATREPDSGRTKNHGFEGIGLTPDGKTLLALLQTPCVQDSLNGDKIDKSSRNTRLLTWDITNPAEPKLSGEYIYQMDLLASGKHATAQSEILVINADSFLVLERDSNGRGTGKPKEHCRVYLASIKDATNLQSIPATPYSREAGDPHGISLRNGTLPSAIVPVTKSVFVDLLQRESLAKAGFSDLRELPEKWEGLALVEQPGLPAHHHLLLVGVDNDFKTRHAFIKTGAHPEGQEFPVVATAADETPTLLFAYHVELPEYTAPRLADTVHLKETTPHD